MYLVGYLPGKGLFKEISIEDVAADEVEVGMFLELGNVLLLQFGVVEVIEVIQTSNSVSLCK